MKYIILVMSLLLCLACSPKIMGTFQGEVDAWLEESGAEYPVEYYRFKRGKQFKYEVIFCFPNDRGSGRYRLKKDSIRFEFKYLNDPEVQDMWEISDTTWTLPFKMVNDSLILIDGVEFKRW